jgi:hypothetical protein
VKSWNNGIGKDFALREDRPWLRRRARRRGRPRPDGVFCGDPVGQPVMHYGHGYIFFVEQGYAKCGGVVPDLTEAFKFTTADGFN